jgi:hypothetical protein
MKTDIGLVLGVFLALAHPVRAATGDSSGGTDTLPPPQTYLAVYVGDSATGLPLGGAEVNARNPEANFTVAGTNARGWAYFARNQLPGPNTINQYWVTAGYPGYVSNMITISACASDAQPCVLRFGLARATEKNSLTFTGSLLDSASRKPIAGYSFDLSLRWPGGWMTYPSRTDDSGRFVFTGIPISATIGYFWIRAPQRIDEWKEVNLHVAGNPILVSRVLTTSLAPSYARPHAAARGKSVPLVLFRSRNRDAVGRLRD